MSENTVKVQIKHRWNDLVLFECDVPESLDSGLRTRHALEKATRAGAYLADANLAGAYLARAYLADANLADANLAGAYLARANLADANLAGAYLARANLADANLAGAKWRDGIVINKTPLQLYGLRWPVTILDEHMQIGCELHNRRIAEMDGRDALRFWRDHKDALMAIARSAGRGESEAAAAAVGV